jgi:hypothetical protein
MQSKSAKDVLVKDFSEENFDAEGVPPLVSGTIIRGTPNAP